MGPAGLITLLCCMGIEALALIRGCDLASLEAQMEVCHPEGLEEASVFRALAEPSSLSCLFLFCPLVLLPLLLVLFLLFL